MSGLPSDDLVATVLKYILIVLLIIFAVGSLLS